MKSVTETWRQLSIRLDSFIAANPLEDPALLALAFCYDPFDFSWLSVFSF